MNGAEYGRKLMDDLQAESRKAAKKAGVTPAAFWDRIKAGMADDDLRVAYPYVKTAGEFLGLKPAENHNVNVSGNLMATAVQVYREMAVPPSGAPSSPEPIPSPAGSLGPLPAGSSPKKKGTRKAAEE